LALAIDLSHAGRRMSAFTLDHPRFLAERRRIDPLSPFEGEVGAKRKVG
jgi:hypothetical protein